MKIDWRYSIGLACLLSILLAGAAETAVSVDLPIQICPPLPSSLHSLILNMSEDAYQGDAQYAVTVDAGGPVTTTYTGSVTVTRASGQTQPVTIPMPDGAHTVRLTFTNDACGNPCGDAVDRNLFLNGATYDGKPIIGSLPTVFPIGLWSQPSNGGATAFLTVPPATVTGIAFANQAGVLWDNAPTGTKLATAFIGVSDGTLYNGQAPTFSTSDKTFFAMNGVDVVTARTLTAADDNQSFKTTISSNLSVPAKNLTTQVVPTPQSAGVPQAATDVGFATVALNSDFTQQMPKNWLGGCPNGPDGSAVNTSDNAGHVWYQNLWWKSNEQPCSVAQTPDPAYGGLTVDMPWVVHYAGLAGGDGYSMQSAGWNWPTPDGQGKNPSVGFAAPNNAYYEITARTTPNAHSNVMNLVTWAVTGITGGDAGIEWDVMELTGDGAGDGAVHNWGAGSAGGWLWTTFNAQGAGNDLLKADPTYDPTKYNTYALRTVSDGTSMRSCTYLNNHLIRCADLPGGLTTPEKTQRTFLLPGPYCYGGNDGNTCPLEGQTQHMYIRSIRVFSCPSWATTECNLATIPAP